MVTGRAGGTQRRAYLLHGLLHVSLLLLLLHGGLVDGLGGGVGVGRAGLSWGGGHHVACRLLLLLLLRGGLEHHGGGVHGSVCLPALARRLAAQSHVAELGSQVVLLQDPTSPTETRERRKKNNKTCNQKRPNTLAFLQQMNDLNKSIPL